MLIAHIADLHVSADGRPVHDLVDTDAATRGVIEAVNAARPDVVLVAGDLTHDGDLAAAERARAMLAGLDAPVYVCPGNHDSRDTLRAAFGRRTDDVCDDWMAYAVEDLPVRLIAMDAATDDPMVGELAASQVAWLAERLAEQPERPTAIFLHHPPFDTGIDWLDQIGISRGRDDLGAVLAAHRNVRALLCGHLHRPMRGGWYGAPVLAAPSVMDRVAFVGENPDGSPVAAIAAPPGFALHRVVNGTWRPDLCFLNGHFEEWQAALPDPWAKNSGRLP